MPNHIWTIYEKQHLEYCKNIIKKNKIEFIDLKAIDLTGRLHHISLPVYPNILEKLINRRRWV